MKKKTIAKRKLHKDCWDLYSAFAKWLEVRLPVYLSDASKIINLDYHKVKLDGREYTQRQLIERMLSDIRIMEEYYLMSEEYEHASEDLLRVWALSAPFMWW